MLSLLAGLAACAGPNAAHEDAQRAPRISYFDPAAPGDTPSLFAPGLVSTEAIELNAVFTPDFRELFFTRIVEDVPTMFRSVLGESGWSAPRPLLLYPGEARAMAVDMAVSPDGTELYFLGRHAHEHASGPPGEDLWVSRREGSGWSTARALPPPVHSEWSEIYPSVVDDGSLYFSSDRPDGRGRRDLFRAQRLPDGSFAEPALVGPPIRHESGIGDVYVAPDERTLIFSSTRPPSAGRGDLFASFRLPDGTWSEPTSLGPALNTADHEYCPMLSPDGAYLFFSRRYGPTRERSTGGDVFWVDARVVERLRPPDAYAR